MVGSSFRQQLELSGPHLQMRFHRPTETDCKGALVRLSKWSLAHEVRVCGGKLDGLRSTSQQPASICVCVCVWNIFCFWLSVGTGSSSKAAVRSALAKMCGARVRDRTSRSSGLKRTGECKDDSCTMLTDFATAAHLSLSHCTVLHSPCVGVSACEADSNSHTYLALPNRHLATLAKMATWAISFLSPIT
jgi:hypothetical protein